jgi:hypothetical protein
MAGYYGTVDKKSAFNILDNGLAFLKDEIKDINEDNKDRIIEEFYRLEEFLYKEARNVVAMSYLVKFEKRLNTIRKKVEKL